LQAVGKLPIDVNAMHIDLLSISGHKLYGPKGIGALYIRRRPRVRLEAQMSGGGQERGLRSGTVPHFLAVGGSRAVGGSAPDVGKMARLAMAQCVMAAPWWTSSGSSCDVVCAVHSGFCVRRPCRGLQCPLSCVCCAL
jgi:hypothetical protein